MILLFYRLLQFLNPDRLRADGISDLQQVWQTPARESCLLFKSFPFLPQDLRYEEKLLAWRTLPEDILLEII